MPRIYYKCQNCGFECLLNVLDTKDSRDMFCLECGAEMIYSEQLEKDWINEVDENGKRLRKEFKGYDEQYCLSEACDYFECEKRELDYYIVKPKGVFGSLTIRAWKPNSITDSKSVMITTDSSNVNGWVMINAIEKIITIRPNSIISSLTPIHFKYDKISALKHKESAGSVVCELILEPHKILHLGFYPKERENVDVLIDALYDDLPQSENDIYIECFFKKDNIPDNRRICHVAINNIDIDFGSSCFIWREAEFLCICNTVIRSGIKIKVSNIKYYRIVGDKYVTTEVTGGGGGGSSIKGAIIGGIIAGEVGAVIGSRKPLEGVKSNSTMHDKQTVLLYSSDLTKILKFNSNIYKILLDLLPEKEYESVLHTSEQPSTTQQPVSNISGIADTRLKLKELKSMLEEDLITEEEYNNKKQELLSKM